jgi:hypothetical protein
VDLARATAQTPHTSLFRRRLECLAAGRPLDDWLVEELNRRGHWGAYTTADVAGAPSPGVSLEELIVALAMPNAEADGRHWKLIVRALQRGPFDGRRLARLARMERAEVVLAWLLRGTPQPERTAPLEALAVLLNPRCTRAPNLRYDFDRLLKRPATREDGWRRPRG